MSCQTPSIRPMKTIVVSFLILSVITMAVAAAEKVGWIDSSMEKRALGLIIGFMATAVGNSLPKVRPLQGAFTNAAKALAAERFAGWALVLSGIVYIVLFIFFPLNQARQIASVAGISALLLIAARWIWFALSRVPRIQSQEDTTVAASKRLAEKRKVLASLLLSFVWVLTSACAVFVLGKKTWFSPSGLWSMTTCFFLVLHSILAAFLDRKAAGINQFRC